jgi:hypothetical protein
VTGKAAAGEATAVAEGLEAGVDVGGADGLVEGFPAVEHATRAIDSKAMKRDGTPKRLERAGIEGLRSGRPEGSRRRETPRFDRSKEGSGDAVHGPAYLSLEGSSMHRGSATGLPLWERFTVAGLCRNRTGFATTRRSRRTTARA